MPAPVSSSFSACSSSVTRKPLCASISAALNPPMPAPEIRTLRDDATALLGSSGFGQRAGCRPRCMGIQARIVAIKRRAIRTDDLLVGAHVEEHMGMVERGLGADAHEFARADLDHRNARIVVEVGNDMVGHGSVSFSVQQRGSAPHHSDLPAAFLVSRTRSSLRYKLRIRANFRTATLPRAFGKSSNSPHLERV